MRRERGEHLHLRPGVQGGVQHQQVQPAEYGQWHCYKVPLFAETLLEMQDLFILDLQVLLLNMEVITKLPQQVVKVNIKIFLLTSQIFFTRQISSF